MKKNIGILILILALSLVGCQSGNTRNENAESAMNVTKSENTNHSKNITKNKNAEPSNNVTKNQDIESKKNATKNENNALSQSIEKNKDTEPSNNIEKSKNTEAPVVTDDTSNTKVKDSTSTNTQENSNTKTNQPNNNLNEESKKQEYVTKLDNIELDLENLNNTEKTTEDMMNHANQRYKQWNDALNEIYSVLEKQLSSDEMKNLQNEEIQWLEKTVSIAKNDSSEMNGGTMESVLYTNSLAQSTKERCYDLVDKYIK